MSPRKAQLAALANHLNRRTATQHRNVAGRQQALPSCSANLAKLAMGALSRCRRQVRGCGLLHAPWARSMAREMMWR